MNAPLPTPSIDIGTTYVRLVLDAQTGLNAAQAMIVLWLAAAADDGCTGVHEDTLAARLLGRAPAVSAALIRNGLGQLAANGYIREVGAGVWALDTESHQIRSLAGILPEGYPGSPPHAEGHQAVKFTPVASILSGRGCP